MFLFAKNLDEDYRFMKEGVEKGIISRERLDDAVTRILALKASLSLHKQNNIPTLERAEANLRTEYARNIAKEVSDESITLVKNLDNILPLQKDKLKNVLI